jgi:hypothetical protein
MIQISGSTQRLFLFPASMQEAFAFYSDIPRSIDFLPHISVVRSFAPGQYRLLYSSLESGLYRVKIYCDVCAILDEEKRFIRIQPSDGKPPVKSESGVYSMTSQGFYDSEVAFSEAGDQTRIEYSIRMGASLPVPLSLRLIPQALLNGSAQRKLSLHTDEIIDRFVERSIRLYTLEK